MITVGISTSTIASAQQLVRDAHVMCLHIFMLYSCYIVLHVAESLWQYDCMLCILYTENFGRGNFWQIITAEAIGKENFGESAGSLSVIYW